MCYIMDKNMKRKAAKSPFSRDDAVEMLRRSCLMDDAFMSVFFDGEPECVRSVLSRIPGLLGEADIVSAITQAKFSSISGRDVVLDVYASDSNGRKYDVEFLNYREADLVRRAVCHWIAIGASELRKGSAFSDLPDICVVFVCRIDYFGDGIAVHRFRTADVEAGITADCGCDFVFVSLGLCGDRGAGLGGLAHDLKCAEAVSIRDEALRRRMIFLKETKEGNKLMKGYWGKVMEQGMERGMERGMAKGRSDVQAENVRRMLAKGRDEQEICECLGLTAEEFRKAVNSGKQDAPAAG